MKKPASLAQLLCQFKDTRRKQGRRHSVGNILLIVILSNMNQYYGYRGIEDFCKRYKVELNQALGFPRHGLPSYSSVRRVMMNLDFDALSSIFYHWVKGKSVISRDEWLQIDGKGMKGTMTDYASRYQNFVSLVSLFANRLGLVLTARQMNNRQESEILTVQRLIAQLDLKGMVLTMDALHCQKKLLTRFCNPAMTFW